MSTNPLQRYFRNPIFVKLPSNGKYYRSPIELETSGEIKVFPMTAADDIILKNPEALLNGSALEHLFRSCVPGIKNPKEIPVQDVDVLLLAIKLASNGGNLEVDTTCPKCNTELSFSASIHAIIEGAVQLPEDNAVRINEDLVAYIRPHDFESRTIVEMTAFEENKMLEHITQKSDLSTDEKITYFNNSIKKIALMNIELTAKRIMHIVTPDGIVDNEEHILDFIRNSDKSVTDKIEEGVKRISVGGVQNELDVTCTNEKCKHEWKSPLVLDPTTFFG